MSFLHQSGNMETNFLQQDMHTDIVKKIPSKKTCTLIFYSTLCKRHETCIENISKHVGLNNYFELS